MSPSDQPKPTEWKLKSGQALPHLPECKQGNRCTCPNGYGENKYQPTGGSDEAYNELARNTPRESRSPFSSKPTEWTVETIEEWIQLNPTTWKSVLAFEHNAELAAEREKHQTIVDGMDGVIGEANTEIQQLREQSQR